MEITQFVLASDQSDCLHTGNFRIEKKSLNELKDNEVLLKSWYFSVDLI